MKPGTRGARARACSRTGGGKSPPGSTKREGRPNGPANTHARLTLRSQSFAFLLALASAASLAAAAWTGCGTSDSPASPDAGGVPGGSATCPACVTDQDCNGGLCAQVGGDTYCAPACPNGDECAADR